MSVKFFWDGEKIDTMVCPGKIYTGFEGIVHGGVQTALLDEAMGWAITMEKKTFVLTRELKVEFLRPVKTDETYRLEAKAVRHLKRVSYATGHLEDTTGKVCAKAEGTFFQMKRAQAREVNNYLIYAPGDLQCFE